MKRVFLALALSLVGSTCYGATTNIEDYTAQISTLIGSFDRTTNLFETVTTSTPEEEEGCYCCGASNKNRIP